MKVCREYDIVDSSTNKATGKTLYALKPTGNWTIFTDDGQHLESTDDEHLQANIDQLTKMRDGFKGLLQVEEHE